MEDKTRRVVYGGLFTALSIILARLSISIPVAGIRGLVISPGAIPVIVAGFMYGPLTGAIVGGVGDIIGFVINPTGPYFPGFTISGALSGALPVMIRRVLVRRTKKDSFITLAVSIGVSRVVVTLLNTLWLHILFGRGLLALLPTRIASLIFTIPFLSLVIYIIEKALAKAGYPIQESRLR